MIKLLLFRFWPILIPIFLYLAWLWLAKKSARKKGDTVPTIKDGPWLWTIFASLIIGIACMIWLGLSSQPEKTPYAPAQIKDGKLVPSQRIETP